MSAVLDHHDHAHDDHPAFMFDQHLAVFIGAQRITGAVMFVAVKKGFDPASEYNRYAGQNQHAAQHHGQQFFVFFGAAHKMIKRPGCRQ